MTKSDHRSDQETPGLRSHDDGSIGGFIPGNILQINASSLSLPVVANHVDVTHVNGILYVDFGFVDHTIAMGKVLGTPPIAVDFVSRVALSIESSAQLIDLLLATARRAGYRIEVGNRVPPEEERSPGSEG